MKKTAIIGAGGFGREVKTLIDDINKIKPSYELLGFFDDNLEKGKIINGIPILGTISTINQIDYNLNLALGIGNPQHKEQIVLNIKNNKVKYPSLIHPSVIVSADNVIFGKGNVICAGNILTCNIRLKDFVTLNLSCTIGHDTVISNFCSFMPAVNISGEVYVKEKVYVGTGTKIINRLNIGENTIIGAGALVSKSLPANCTAVGVPAKPIKFHEER